MTDTTAIPQALIGYIDEEAECIRLKKRNEITAPIAVLLIDEAKLKAWKMFLPDELEKHAVHNKYRQSCRLFSRVSNLPEGVKELSSGDVKAVFSDYPLPIPIGEVWSGNPSDELPVVDYADVAKLFGEEVPRAVSEHPDGPELIKNTQQAAEVAPADVHAQVDEKGPEESPSDYREYLVTDAAKALLHGIFAVYPLRKTKDAHTTGKQPCGIGGHINGGVKNFQHSAAEVMKVLNSEPAHQRVIKSVRSFLVSTAQIEAVKAKDEAAKQEALKEVDYLKNVKITLCLGRVFSVDDGIMGLDFDGHHPDPDVSNGTGYREVSSSGTGDHILFRVPKEMFPAYGNKLKRDDIELFYGKGTGVAISGYKATTGSSFVLDLNSEAGKMVKSLLSTQQMREEEKTTTPVVASSHQPTANKTGMEIPDEEIIRLIKKDVVGCPLWSGSTDRYPSASEADSALCCKLAFYTGKNTEQMERLFLQSGLGQRDKAQRRDYIERTISNACGAVTDVYNPNYKLQNSVTTQTEKEGTHKGNLPQGYNWQYQMAHQECANMAGNLPNIKHAGKGLYVIIDPEDNLAKLVSKGTCEEFRRWCYQVFPDYGYDAKFAEAVWDNIAVLHTADPIPPIEIEAAITAIPCKNGYISLKDGKRCERPAEMEYCPFILNLTVEEAEYNPYYQPKGRVLRDLGTYLGIPTTKYLLNLIAACMPRIPANRRVTLLTGVPRSSKTTAGKILGELGLAPPKNIDFSTEIDGKGRFRHELAKNIAAFPVIFINDPVNPDGNAIKKLCDTAQQYERKYEHNSSVYQRATCVLTMNHAPDFKTSGMEAKTFFVCSVESYVGEEIPDDKYMAELHSDGSLVDFWQEILKEGLRSNWEIEIPPECNEHNKRMQAGTTPFQRWLSACKKAESNTENFVTLHDIYVNCIIACNPETDPDEIKMILNNHRCLASWVPTARDGFTGKSKAELKKELLAVGFTPHRVNNQRGYYIRLPSLGDNGEIITNKDYASPKYITTVEVYNLLH